MRREPRERSGDISRLRLRRRAAAVLLAPVAVAVSVAGVWQPWHRGGQGAASGVYPPFLGTVTFRTLTEQTPVAATLGFAGSYTVVNHAQGTYTALPTAGQVINQGQVAYQVSGVPAVLLYGRVPAWRPLSEGMTGADVQQLNRDLVTLGYASATELDPGSDYFSANTACALERLQAHLGVSQTGSLNLGDAVFLPSAARVTAVPATLGGAAAPGTPVLTATSTVPQVTIALDAAMQSDVKAGDPVAITLPDQQTTAGVITSVGTVATSAPPAAGSSGPPGSGSGATITVDVSLLHPAAAGGLDQAPVQALITTGKVSNVLAVPVTALLATTSGYQVQVAGPGARYRLIPVTLGLFDDAAGLVQASGPGLHAGLKVVEAQA